MSLMSNKGILQLRRAARAVGVPKLLGRFTRRYEGAFSEQLMAACRTGDVVWDVGANVGGYTLPFAERVGPTGAVFAFEPSEANLRELDQACRERSNIKICAFGLSDKEERQRFLEGGDRDHTTSRVLMPNESAVAGTMEVELRTGDAIIKKGEVPLPSVVKIDVEGHELSVLKGLKSTLGNRGLRQLFVEVHFAILDRSGRSDDPKKIEAILRRNGFKLKWIDPSHIQAFRSA